ncbi:hypothetical protein ACTXG7_01715 [Mycolicibacterium sp. Dal123E01]|uniref:hypothetical protein n=1 Tax=Mycolicibacterium sp. Dal123E01 TaxID=3457578 RepID=UPI00403EEB37
MQALKSASTASWLAGATLAIGVGLAVSTGTAIANADPGSGSGTASHGPSNSSAPSPTGAQATGRDLRSKQAARSARAAGPLSHGIPSTQANVVVALDKSSTTSRAAPVSDRRSAAAPIDLPKAAADVPGVAAANAVSTAAQTSPTQVSAVPAWGRQIEAALSSLWHDIEAAVSFVYRRITTFVADIVDGSFPWDFPHGTSPTAGPDDVVHTVYGDIGKWMLRPTSAGPQVSDWLGQKYWGRNLLEPINVVIVDRTSTTAAESAQKVIDSLTAAGFPTRVKHSTGYEGSIGGIDYSQEPTGAEQAFSNDFYLFPNDHGRFFGPAPATDGVGFIWVAALSRERVGVYDRQFTHRYVSFDRARDALRAGLVGIGAVDLGTINLDNAVNNATQTTGDHDGYAVVIELA